MCGREQRWPYVSSRSPVTSLGQLPPGFPVSAPGTNRGHSHSPPEDETGGRWRGNIDQVMAEKIKSTAAANDPQVRSHTQIGMYYVVTVWHTNTHTHTHTVIDSMCRQNMGRTSQGNMWPSWLLCNTVASVKKLTKWMLINTIIIYIFRILFACRIAHSIQYDQFQTLSLDFFSANDFSILNT